MDWKEATKLALRASPFRNPFGIAGAGLIVVGIVVIIFGVSSQLFTLSKNISNPSTTNIPYIGEISIMPTMPNINFANLLIPVGIGITLMVAGGILFSFAAQVGQITVFAAVVQNAFSGIEKGICLSQPHDQRLCPKCGSPVPKGFQFCLHCGSEVT